MQVYGTRHILDGLTGLYEDPDRHAITGPVNMVVDVGAGNVIVATGMRGYWLWTRRGFEGRCSG